MSPLVTQGLSLQKLIRLETCVLGAALRTDAFLFLTASRDEDMCPQNL